MDLAQLQYFLSVADHLSFTKAAEELYVSQPTISKQIALLEKELGIKLFLRSTRGVQLTFAGQTLYPDVRDALRLLEGALGKLAKDTGEARGQINVGIGSMMDINFIMPGFFRAFAQVYPQVRLKIASYPFSTLLQKLDGGALDVVFTYSLETLKNADHSRIAVSRSDTFLYYSPSLMLRESPGLSLQDFVDKPLLRLHTPPSDNYYADTAIHAGTSFQNVLEVPDMETLILYLESGLGFCIMGRSYRVNTSDSIRSIDLTKTDRLPPVGTDAIWCRSNHNPSLRLLLDEMREYTQSGAPASGPAAGD